MTYGDALKKLKDGYRVARRGWSGKGMWVILAPGRTLTSIQPDSFYDKCGFKAGITILPHLDMKTAQGDMCVGWAASQADQLADDWYTVVD